MLSTALFDKPAFKNLVCNGLVLASDGKKMSKRLKNYPDPTIITDKYGADALRLYLINSPVVRAEPLRFEEKGVFGVVKDVFLPWYNAYRFLSQVRLPNVLKAVIPLVTLGELACGHVARGDVASAAQFERVGIAIVESNVMLVETAAYLAETDASVPTLT